MLNYIWLALVLLAVAIGGWNDRWKDVTDGAFDGAKTAVTIALGLIGIMALWLGVMRLAERAGLVQKIARALRPVMRRLFPDVPAEHPAMGAMLMNMAANMLGLGNAATPLGLRAMRDLETLNPHPGIATNAMCTFLAINTASVQLIPTTAIAILVAAGSTRPTAIVGTAFTRDVVRSDNGDYRGKNLGALALVRACSRGHDREAFRNRGTRRERAAKCRGRGQRPRLQRTGFATTDFIGANRNHCPTDFFRGDFCPNGLASRFWKRNHRQRERLCPQRERSFVAGDPIPAQLFPDLRCGASSESL